MILWGKILDKIFQKVPHRFLEKIWLQKIAWTFIYQTKKNNISGTSSTFGATRI